MHAPPSRPLKSPAPRQRPSPAPVTALVVVTVIGTGVWLLVRPEGPSHDADPGQDPRRAPQYGHTALARTGQAVPPRLVAAPPARPLADEPEAIAGLSQEQLGEVQRLESQARRHAATTLGLSPNELSQLQEIQRQADARRAASGDVAANTALVASARAEFAELTRLLGPARATALRELQAHSLGVVLARASWRRDHPNEAALLTRRRQLLLSLPLAPAPDRAPE